MQLIVFEDAQTKNLLPLVYARAVFDLRCGLDTLLDKIETAFDRPADALFIRPSMAPAMAERQSRPVNHLPDGDNQLWINGRLLVREPFDLPQAAAAWQGDALLAARIDAKTAAQLADKTPQDSATLKAALAACRNVDLPTAAAVLVNHPWQLVHQNADEIARQCRRAGPSRPRLGRVDPDTILLNESAIHLGKGSRIQPTAVLDAENGPIHIGRNVTVGPHVSIVGPCAIGDNCLIRPGAHLADSSIGPVCKIGGEVEETIFQGHANKQHDGFLGHSYVGRWVNLGADTVNSDLKNTYGPVRVPINGRPVDSGETFVGAFIGDHAKTGINVTLPTGCVIGFASNVLLSRTAPKFVPSFTWLTDEKIEVNDPQRALAVAKKVMARRNQKLTGVEEALFLSIAEEARHCEARSNG